MDPVSEQALARLIRTVRTAALATLHGGEPNLAMVAVAVEADFSAFYIHISTLGRHTGDVGNNPHVALLLAEVDDGRNDPQTLARVSFRGIADPVSRTDGDYARIKNLYLARFPEAEPLFSFSDFSLWRISPKGGRFVAGFGKAFDITPATIEKVQHY